MKENDNKKNYIKIAIYSGILLLAIIITRITNMISPSKTNTKNKDTIKIIEIIKNINEDYYTEKIHLTLDDDAIYLDLEKISTIEAGIKKYHNTKTEFIKHESNYYKLENENFVSLNNFDYFDYDKTFIDLKNIKKLLELNNNYKITNNNDERIIKITYKLSEILGIYNEYNGTNLENSTNGTITLEVHYIENELKFLLINTTEFYNFINGSEQEEVLYKIELKENKKQDINWILEKIK